MADISKITLPSGTTYDIKDTVARATAGGGLQFRGVTTTALTDGASTSTYSIGGTNHTAANGDMVVYGNKEFVFSTSDNKWHELGDNTSLKALAYKDDASGSYQRATSVTVTTNATSNKTATVSPASSGTATYTPGGSLSGIAWTGGTTESTGKFTPAGSISLTNSNKTATVSTATINTNNPATYTPSGTIGTPTISVKTAGSTTTVNSITAVGTLPSLTTSVENETLTIGWSAGTLPTKGENTTVKTGDAAYEASQPTFSGTGVRLVTGNISVPTSASFSGTEDDISVSGTSAGSITNQGTFTGTGVRLVTGNIAVPDTYTATIGETSTSITVS